ncbi:MAG: DUF3152 domain-containing protein [Kineosporiaceae bacterium]|nr:DUF3152 domain-containing protein [Aeromicrobium sp.]
MISTAAALITVPVALFTLGDDDDPQSPAGMVAEVIGPTLSTPSALPTKATPTKPKPTPSVVVPARGSGAFGLASGGTGKVGAGRLVTYRVEAEKDLAFRAADFAEAVDATLTDPRGWTKTGSYAFQRTDSAALRVVLATPSTTDRLCAPLQTRGTLSCRSGNDVVINARRWVDGADSYKGELAKYRQYVINHEVGHSLGLGHVPCPRAGAKAPVMLQQSLGLQSCEANPWP